MAGHAERGDDARPVEDRDPGRDRRACELIDFWRFNVAFARQILAEQPVVARASGTGLDHRPLEGFVYAITPFNFTAIAGNLPTAPALMGNTVVWKPSPTQQLAAHYTMRLLEEAGLPPGVINMVPGDGIAVSEVALADPTLAGIHFTGSTPTFQRLWQTVGENIAGYRATRGSSARPAARTSWSRTRPPTPTALRTALIRGAFEYQGQKCSAASRAYVARIAVGPDERRLPRRDRCARDGRRHRLLELHGRGHRPAGVRQARGGARPRARASDGGSGDRAGGSCDDSEGYFVRPTVLVE